MAVEPADYVRAATRWMKLSETEQQEVKGKTPPQMFEKIEAEAAALNFIVTMCAVYEEQGVLDDVLTFLSQFSTLEGRTPLLPGV